MSRTGFAGRNQIPISLSFYLLIFLSFLSPYFTPPSTLGPEGILRFDQVILPILLFLVVISSGGLLELNLSAITKALFGIALLILLSFLYSVYFLGIQVRIGEIYDIVIWFSYVALIAIVPSRLSLRTAKISVIILICSGIIVSIFGILQGLEVSLITPIDEIYSPTKRITRDLRRANGTTVNPNLFSEVIAIPLLATVSLVYRFSGRDTSRYLNSKYFFLASSVIMILCLYFTYSRSGAAGTLIGVCALAAIILFSKVGGKRKRRQLATIIMALPISLFIILVTVNYDFGRYSSILNLASDSSLQTRIERWLATITVIKDSILLGYGPSKQALPVDHADSGILNWWFHYGLISVFMFLFFVSCTLKCGFGIAKDRTIYQNRPYIWAISTSIASWSVAIPAIWIFLPVPAYRRPFTIFLLAVSIVLTTVISDKKEGDNIE